MEYKDYYKTLGIEKNATADDIKKQYRRLARKYHPDVSKEKNAEEQFKEVKEAYEVLKNPQKRKAYDQMGSHWKSGESFRTPPNWDSQQNGATQEQFDTSGFSDFFENLFGQRRSAQGHHQADYSQPGEDLSTKITITLEEAFHGTERTLQLQEPDRDPATGEIHIKTRSLKVKIPAGVIEGQQIRLPQQGGKGIGKAPNGNLYLEIHFTDHPLYTVKNRDIYLTLPVTPWEAALGAKVAVPTLNGPVEMTVVAGSQTGKRFRLKGRGLPGNPAGDQYITLAIYIPEPKNDSQRALYKKMADEMNFNPRLEMNI